MKSLLALGAAIATLGLGALAACSSSSSGTFIPNEGGAEGGKTGAVGADGKVPTGGECPGATQAAANACTGNACIALNANKQGKSGICTESCASGTCSKGGTCIEVPNEGPYCFKACKTDNDCVDGFICVDDGAGDTVCLVSPVTTSSSDAGTE